MTRLYGTQLGSSYLQDPLIGIADSLPADLAWLRDLLRPWLAVLISISLFLAANAVVGGSGASSTRWRGTRRCRRCSGASIPPA